MSDRPRVLGVAWLPLDEAALCCNCQKFYSAEELACPACGATDYRLVREMLRREGATA